MSESNIEIHNVVEVNSVPNLLLKAKEKYHNPSHKTDEEAKLHFSNKLNQGLAEYGLQIHIISKKQIVRNNYDDTLEVKDLNPNKFSEEYFRVNAQRIVIIKKKMNAVEVSKELSDKMPQQITHVRYASGGNGTRVIGTDMNVRAMTDDEVAILVQALLFVIAKVEEAEAVRKVQHTETSYTPSQQYTRTLALLEELKRILEKRKEEKKKTKKTNDRNKHLVSQMHHEQQLRKMRKHGQEERRRVADARKHNNEKQRLTKEDIEFDLKQETLKKSTLNPKDALRIQIQSSSAA